MNTQPALDLFERIAKQLPGLLAPLTDDGPAVVEQARQEFAAMAPDLAYLDKPNTPLAGALWMCAAHLAAYQVVRKSGIDAHAYGARMLQHMAGAPVNEEQDASEEVFDLSGVERTHPGEFEVENVSDEQFDWGVNIKSCAICYLFSQHDAMDLVPYMCASDDVVSDLNNQGLQRTGTIALGAHQCDFRYKSGGAGLAVAAQYPDKIKLLG